MGAQLVLKIVIMAGISPPKTPNNSQPPPLAGSRGSMKLDQGKLAVARAHSSRIPVRFTVPFKVMRFATSRAPPNLAASWNALEPRAGFEVLKRGIRVISVFRSERKPLNCKGNRAPIPILRLRL